MRHLIEGLEEEVKNHCEAKDASQRINTELAQQGMTKEIVDQEVNA